MSFAEEKTEKQSENETEVHQASEGFRDNTEIHVASTLETSAVTARNFAENQIEETGFQSSSRESYGIETTVNEPAHAEEYTINETLPQAKLKYEFFWDRDDVFSQWHNSEFTVDGKNFSCAEQYMMYMKAVLLHDDTLAQRILKCTDPKRMKSLGRKTKQFSEDLWLHNCLHVVKEGNVAKFSQNENLKQKLFGTYPRVLVEASPYDRVWGIGISMYEPCAWNEPTWDGKNLLGFILTEVRDELMCKDGIIKETEKQVYFDKLMDDLKKTSFGTRQSHDRHWRAQCPDRYYSYEGDFDEPYSEGTDTTKIGQSTDSSLLRKPEGESTEYQNVMDSSIKSREGTISSNDHSPCENSETLPGAQRRTAVELTRDVRKDNERLTDSKTESVGTNMQHDRPYDEEIERQ